MDLNYGENNSLHFEFIDSKLSASVCNDEGEFTIQSYNLQKELRSITKLSTLETYFENAFFKVKELDDGDYKLEVNQKGYGGVPPKNDTGGNKEKGGNKDSGKDKADKGGGNKGACKTEVCSKDKNGNKVCASISACKK